MTRKHFHTFDALRFFSFLLVFFLHSPKTDYPYINFFLKSGGLGVSFFFTLSGFLITYILLHEKESQKKISLKKFFLRRILRIWPLFYLMIAFAYLSPYILQLLNLPFENNGYKPNLITSLFFAENYKMMLTNTFPDGAPLRVMWSLCVEEHFYIIWGIALSIISPRKTPLLIVFSIIFATIIRLIYSYYGISSLDIFSNIDYFAFGAIPAYIFMYKKNFISQLSKISISLKYLFLILTVVSVFTYSNYITTIKPLASLFFGLLFSTTILLTLGKNEIHINDNLWFSKLGTYTYGLYLYHTIVIILFVKIFKRLDITNWFILTITTLVTTITISIVSYHLFEKQFIKLKKYFY